MAELRKIQILEEISKSQSLSQEFLVSICSILNIDLDSLFPSRFSLLPLMIDNGMLLGEVCHGIYDDKINKFEHCWISYEDKILDITVWGKFGKDPSIVFEKTSSKYDVNGTSHSVSVNNSIPQVDFNLPSFHIETGSEDSDQFVGSIFNNQIRLSKNQVEWLAKVPNKKLEKHSLSILTWVKDLGFFDDMSSENKQAIK